MYTRELFNLTQKMLSQPTNALALDSEYLEFVTQSCARAFDDGDEAAKYDVHATLFHIYDLMRIIPKNEVQSRYEQSLNIFAARNIIEETFLRSEEAKIQTDALEGIPTEPGKLTNWMISLIKGHPAYRHAYYETTLAEQADRDELAYYLTQESSVDARFDDFLALLQVGTPDQVKMEIASNYWDEMGNGEIKAMHTRLFDEVLRYMDISPDDMVGEMNHVALANGNMSWLFAFKRSQFYKAIGFFAVTEYLAPTRFARFLDGWERLGLSEEAATYHREHIQIDVHHAIQWFRNVIEPVVSEDPSRVRDIVMGALMRLQGSFEYLELLQSRPRPVLTAS